MPRAATTASTERAMKAVRNQLLFLTEGCGCTGVTGIGCHPVWCGGWGGAMVSACGACSGGPCVLPIRVASAGFETGAPHWVQNFRFDSRWLPHLEQKFMVFNLCLQALGHC